MIRINSFSEYNPSFQNRTKKTELKEVSANSQPITTKLKHDMVNGALALALLVPAGTSCTESNTRTNNNHNEAVCEIEPKEQIKDCKNVAITKGFVSNRSIEEIKKITGLNEIEYKTAAKMLLEGATKTGKSLDTEQLYNLGTEYKILKHTFGDNDTIFRIKIGLASGKKYFTYKYNKADKEFSADVSMIPIFSQKHKTGVKIIREDNGDFTCIGSYITYEGGLTLKDHIIVRNFTKDGELKPWDYIPNTDSENELKELEQQEKVKESPSVIIDDKKVKSNSTDIKDISFFKNNNKDAIAKFATALGLSNIEYINKNGTNIFFAEGPNCSYHLNLKKNADDNDTFIGIVNKALNDGKSEIYLLKAEMFSTNKSDKLILSKMRVVQDGLDENSPIYKKYIKETSTTGGRTSSTTHDLKAKSINPWFQLFVTQKFYDGKLSSKTVDEIDELVTESNSDGKVIKIVSIDKASGKITIQGE